jgi:hypothetical protein
MATKTVDTNALRFNQISIVVLVLAGYIFDIRILPAIVAVILLLGAVSPRYSLFRWVYSHLIVPAGLLSPQIVEDDGAAHRFAQALGGVTLTAAVIALYFISNYAGWALAWVVVLLAGVNLAFGFCTGCFIYYQIRKFRASHAPQHAHGS